MKMYKDGAMKIIDDSSLLLETLLNQGWSGVDQTKTLEQTPEEPPKKQGRPPKK
jgi:hypothetical protein